jgi:hypothetical protein
VRLVQRLDPRFIWKGPGRWLSDWLVTDAIDAVQV